jgi:hypothetical protein
MEPALLETIVFKKKMGEQKNFQLARVEPS